jgi:hypothetical protein
MTRLRQHWPDVALVIDRSFALRRLRRGGTGPTQREQGEADIQQDAHGWLSNHLRRTMELLRIIPCGRKLVVNRK